MPRPGSGLTVVRRGWQPQPNGIDRQLWFDSTTRYRSLVMQVPGSQSDFGWPVCESAADGRALVRIAIIGHLQAAPGRPRSTLLRLPVRGVLPTRVQVRISTTYGCGAWR